MEKIIEEEETKNGNYNDKNYDKSNGFGGYAAAYVVLGFFVNGIIAFFISFLPYVFIALKAFLWKDNSWLKFGSCSCFFWSAAIRAWSFLGDRYILDCFPLT